MVIHDAIAESRHGLLRIGIFAKQQETAEACSDRLLGYNPIGVASGRFMQAAGTPTNDAEISYCPRGGRRARSRFRRIFDRALPFQALLTPGILA